MRPSRAISLETHAWNVRARGSGIPPLLLTLCRRRWDPTSCQLSQLICCHVRHCSPSLPTSYVAQPKSSSGHAASYHLSTHVEGSLMFSASLWRRSPISQCCSGNRPLGVQHKLRYTTSAAGYPNLLETYMSLETYLALQVGRCVCVDRLCIFLNLNIKCYPFVVCSLSFLITWKLI